MVGNDGWESVATDIIGIHDYDADAERLRPRYEHVETVPQLFKHGAARRAAPDARRPPASPGQPVMLTEFGGIALARQRGPRLGLLAGRRRRTSFADRFTRAARRPCRGSELLAGFCYTQFADTYQEANGLLYADRTPKFPLERDPRARCAGRGPRVQHRHGAAAAR